MTALIELFATLATGIFAGAALYVSLVEHPARVSCGTTLAITEFRPSYERGAVMQVTLALVGTVAAVLRWGLGGSIGWLIGGLLFGSVVPFTLLVIASTNHRLRDASANLTSLEGAVLLARWGCLHAVRTAVSLVALVMFLLLRT